MGNGAINMELILTANVANNMYWLGRYLQRIEETLYEINNAYDLIIDVDKDAGKKLYKKFDIDLKYYTATGFLHHAIKGEHSANLIHVMESARENAIISRAYIEGTRFSEIIALNEIFRNIQNNLGHIDYNDIDNVLSVINEIWGTYTHRGHRKSSDYFFELGKLVEAIDFHLRFDRNQMTTGIILKEISIAIKILNPKLDLFTECPKEETKDTRDNIMDCIYRTIDKLIVEE